MFSGEKEKIGFIRCVDPNGKGVEFWMGDVETTMFDSIRYVLKFSVDDYKARPRPQWAMQHPGQCVLNGSQVHWTSEVEAAIKENTLANYLDFLG